MSNGYAADEPRHVELAQIDEDVRRMAIHGAMHVVCEFCHELKSHSGSHLYYDTERPMERKPWSLNQSRQMVAEAVRVLRHFGAIGPDETIITFQKARNA